MRVSWCFWIVLFLVQLTSKFLRADYVVEVHMQSYNNPTNRAIGRGGHCCDHVPGADSNCSKLELCESYFTFCLRPLNTSHTQRGCDAPNITSEVAHNNASIDFTNSTFLGIANPFHLNASGPWQGVQLYVEVIDRDFTTLFAGTVEDDLIDSFDFHLGISSIFESNISITKEGTYGTIGIMARVLCAPLFAGPNCEYCIKQNCSMRGVCVSEELLTCACDPGYTGSDCETDIDEYAVPGDVVGGTVAALLVLVIVIIILLVVIALLVRKKKALSTTTPVTSNRAGDNPTYGIPGVDMQQEALSGAHCTSTMGSDTAEFDNTMYGSSTFVNKDTV